MEGGTDAVLAAAFPSLHAAPSSAARMASGSNLDDLDRIMKSSLHLEEDDFVPELPRSIHPQRETGLGGNNQRHGPGSRYTSSRRTSHRSGTSDALL
ncbi:unnamed protein product [Staurois parvus]|uniref:Uncharacterized protein n=1 Tax=Staurois parvus TaxID=386267 RepID=A0ABN9F1M2_9NEOB|nr:unnamed protein product [Staurois parvus]